MSKFLSIPFRWLSGSLNDNGIRLLREKGIRYCYNSTFNLYAKLGDHWYPVEYHRETNVPGCNDWILDIVPPSPRFARFCPPDNY